MVELNPPTIIGWMILTYLPRTDLVSVFKANVNSVHMVTSAFLPFLKRGKEKKIMNMYGIIFFEHTG
jgi:hypothetical protein